MPMFRKKPIVIEARQFNHADGYSIARWCGGEYHGVALYADVIVIPTLEGDMRANYGDWIIKGVSGEFYPCKAGIFEKTYEPVDDDGRTLGQFRAEAAP